MQEYSNSINHLKVNIILGDMTEIKSEAYLVPQFCSGSSYGGVGGAIANAGAQAGLAEFDAFVKEGGEQKFGTVILSKSGGGHSKYLLHAVTVGSGADQEFGIVQQAVYKALHQSELKEVKSISIPALGTGIIGCLGTVQSAKAMMYAVQKFTEDYPDTEMEISFVIFGDEGGYKDFCSVLDKRDYNNAHEIGTRKFDFNRWAEGMIFHEETTDKFVNAQIEVAAERSKTELKMRPEKAPRLKRRPR